MHKLYNWDALLIEEILKKCFRKIRIFDVFAQILRTKLLNTSTFFTYCFMSIRLRCYWMSERKFCNYHYKLFTRLTLKRFVMVWDTILDKVSRLTRSPQKTVRHEKSFYALIHHKNYSHLIDWLGWYILRKNKSTVRGNT